MNNQIDIHIAIQNLDSQISKASYQFHHWTLTGLDWDDPSWIIETCFLQLLIIAEILSLPEFRRMVYEEYTNTKNSKGGFNNEGNDPDGEPYPVAIGRLNCYSNAIKNLILDDKETTITKDLLQIIRDIHYVITDKSVFYNSPENENDVHVRIEAVLKCIFPDLKHKPVLTKQIKNFIPDTGITSLKTLIEYKFLSKKSDISIIADQLLADTLGYTSKEWKRFLYVIYETNRFRREKDWNLFLQESNVPKNISVVVLGGEPINKKNFFSKKNIKKRT